MWFVLQESMAYDLIIATTKIVNGQTLVETFMEKLGWLMSKFFFQFIILSAFLGLVRKASLSWWCQTNDMPKRVLLGWCTQLMLWWKLCWCYNILFCWFCKDYWEELIVCGLFFALLYFNLWQLIGHCMQVCYWHCWFWLNIPSVTGLFRPLENLMAVMSIPDLENFSTNYNFGMGAWIYVLILF